MTRAGNSFSSTEKNLVRGLVDHYAENRPFIERMLDQLRGVILKSEPLMQYVHSTKWRTKDPSHLRDKLFRKISESKKKNVKFAITKDNLLTKVNDLAGFRILHLHTEQIVDIDRELRALFKEFDYALVETPKARTWDDEYREFYRNAGIKWVSSPTMYTSVHYVVSPNNRTKTTCEIQVRTLAEELWGEVDHSINYPHKSRISACKEQIKVLARVTSSCSRLVDSIYRASKEAKTARRKQAQLRRREIASR